MKIYALVAITSHVLEAFERLMFQLSSECVLPTKEDLETIINSENTIIFIAEKNNDILGTLTLVINKIPTGNKVWIEDVVVDKTTRGMGVGEALTKFAIEYALNKGFNQINLTSSPERVAANTLYQKLGFVKRATNVYRLVIFK